MPPPLFMVPLGPTVPALAIVVALTILAGATPQQLRAGAIALAAGAALYAIARFSSTTRRMDAAPEVL